MAIHPTEGRRSASNGPVKLAVTSATNAPVPLTVRFPLTSRLASGPSEATARQGSTAPPRLAPATNATTSDGVIVPASASMAMKSTTARLDDEAKASIAARSRPKIGP
ncbi:hypothetical protein SAMN06295998_1294 [Primorskyibacter flagellatus]|uniref:Uncharacterized protein n=1 Tax=Primorskyibacter flagellatus TaxID=1387277 RepID=A0A1W2EH54_9RHOB|nr:hypothetical protein SAMN06295998_1294 [Primorskyibacter flagellatus]